MLTFVPLNILASSIVGHEPEPHQNFCPEPEPHKNDGMFALPLEFLNA
jgi:hypothetical protein